VLAILVLLAVVPPASAATVDARPTPRQSLAVDLVADIRARAAPSLSARPVMRLSAIAPLGGGITGLLVTARRRANGRTWYRVLLSRRPNGRQGWIPAWRVRTSRNPIRIEIDLSARRLGTRRRGRPVLSAPVAIGRAAHPTPPGRYAIAENIRTNAPGSYLGAYALALTGFSLTLTRFMGGRGRLAIHGTNRPGRIGTRASHGCAWLAREPLVRLARMARPGTPVVIRP
jgi:lipoprotein-anchoring transpeptidase ErfK/SrfK